MQPYSTRQTCRSATAAFLIYQYKLYIFHSGFSPCDRCTATVIQAAARGSDVHEQLNSFKYVAKPTGLLRQQVVNRSRKCLWTIRDRSALLSAMGTPPVPGVSMLQWCQDPLLVTFHTYRYKRSQAESISGSAPLCEPHRHFKQRASVAQLHCVSLTDISSREHQWLSSTV
jgi:hypothetical protein